MDLLFDLSGRFDGHPTLVGTMTRAIVASAATPFLGVRFLPGEAFALVRVPAGEARDRVVPMDQVLGPLASAMADELASAPDLPARLAILDRRLEVLHARARPADRRVRQVVGRILRSPAEARVAWLARDAGIGERQLERAFVERVGLGPKAFARVARLQALLPRLVGASGARTPWAAHAADLGYADQAHMIREIKELAGVTPTELARERTMSDSFNAAGGLADTTVG
jgi:AraC-like DNA-binding protein